MKIIQLVPSACIVLVGLCVPASAQTFTGAVSNDYGTAGNWSTGSVPVLSNGATAIINNGAAVTYNPGGDLLISNGGELEISNGSWTQIGGNNFIQLGQQGAGPSTGNGTILVNGGTFNQGTDSARPFNVIGTGNLFEITSGTANFNNTLSLNAGLTYLQTGGTVNTGTNEFDFNSTAVTIAGGILNTTLLTGVNGGVDSLTFSGGIINLSSGTGIFAGNPSQNVNFTLGSTGLINFENTSVATVEGMLNGGVIQINNVTDAAAFNVVSAFGGNGATLSLIAAAPEPSTYALFGLGVVALVLVSRRRANKA